MMKNKTKIIFFSVFIFLLSAVYAAGIAAYPPEAVSVFGGGDAVYPTAFDEVTFDAGAEEPLSGKIQSALNVSAYQNVRLIPSGDAFGVKFFTKGVLVVGMSEIELDGKSVNPAYDAGIRVKDIIVKINGKEINSIDEMTAAVDENGEGEASFELLREGGPVTVRVKPVKVEDGKYKTGLWVRDSAAGIGTITFIEPESGAFGGLGHGICDVDTGELMPLLKGAVTDVRINGIVKGRAGTPGELRGFFLERRTGALISNTDQGVFGILESEQRTGETVPVAQKGEVKEGKATIRCTLDKSGPAEYEIEILRIVSPDTDTKNFIVRVTDKRLLELTGGIVQGMSGSPILQSGKLVGAVTHVLVGDPQKGYGIFIENMLKGAAEALE